MKSPHGKRQAKVRINSATCTRDIEYYGAGEGKNMFPKLDFGIRPKVEDYLPGSTEARSSWTICAATARARSKSVGGSEIAATLGWPPPP